MNEINYKFEPAFLTKEERLYELYIRNIVGLSSDREETKAIRVALLREERGEEVSPVADGLELSSELELGSVALGDLSDLFIRATVAKDSVNKINLKNCIKARVAAWLNRMLRIPDKSSNEYNRIVTGFKNLWDKVDDIRPDTNYNDEVSNTFSNNNVAGAGALSSPSNNLFKESETIHNITGRGRGRLSYTGTIPKTVDLNRQGTEISSKGFEEFCHSAKLKQASNVTPIQFEYFDNDNGERFEHNGMYRKTVNIRKWRSAISFSGDGNGLSLNEFLLKIKMYAKGDRVSDDDLFRNFHHLLSDRAERWYLGSLGEFKNYDELVRALQVEFLPRNYNFLLKEDIANRVQGPSENFSSFITDLKALFQKVYPPLSEDYKMYVIERNVNAKYQMILAARDFRSVEEVVQTCKRIEGTNFLASRRPEFHSFASNKTVEPSYFPKTTSKPSKDFIARRSNNLREVHALHESDDTLNPEEHGFHGNLGSNNHHCCCSHERKNSGSFSCNQVLAVHQANNNSNNRVVCWKCEGSGHVWFECLKAQTWLFCHLCGTKGVTVKNCRNHPPRFHRNSNGRNFNSNKRQENNEKSSLQNKSEQQKPGNELQEVIPGTRTLPQSN